LISFLIALQLALIVLLVINSGKTYRIISSILSGVSVLVALFIVSKESHPSYKMIWIFLILVFPLFGGLFYLAYSLQMNDPRVRKRLSEIVLLRKQCHELMLKENDDLLPQVCATCDCAPQVKYLQQYVGFPVYDHTQTQYFCQGEDFFNQALIELEKAEKYIFLEFFIIEQGKMWDSILEILARKVNQGVDVRLMYDDMGCFLTLPGNYKKTLEDLGIKCTVFNPFKPVLSSLQNNRDHRKILSIDGKVAFTGGINLADEYINAHVKHGHWKDAAVMISGEAAWSLTLMFLQMWHMESRTTEDFEKFFPWTGKPCETPTDGYVIPYSDSPLDNEYVSEQVYLQIINTAKNYLYINTPYLIVGDNLLGALMLAAKSGVDVRIITPQIWDKHLIHITTRSYYRELVQAGVKIYEYTGGFNHAKTFLADDKVGTVGTVNLDFRSLYLHFECGVWMYGSRALRELKEDFLQTVSVSRQITEEDCVKRLPTRLVHAVLRLFAPLM